MSARRRRSELVDKATLPDEEARGHDEPGEQADVVDDVAGFATGNGDGESVDSAEEREQRRSHRECPRAAVAAFLSWARAWAFAVASTTPRSASGGAAPGKGSIGPSRLACTADAAKSVNAATNISARMNVLTVRAAPASNGRRMRFIGRSPSWIEGTRTIAGLLP